MVIMLWSHVQVWHHDQHVHVHSMCATSVATHESRGFAREQAVVGQVSDRLVKGKTDCVVCSSNKVLCL